MHLVDDAPLLLMISDTFMTLVWETKRSEIGKMADLQKTQRFIWQEQVLYGLVLCLGGLFIIDHPMNVFRSLFEQIIPLAIICLAAIFLVRPFRTRLPEKYRAVDLFQGTGILCAGVFAWFLPLAAWVVTILSILALWMIASAVMLLKRVARGRRAVPEGFSSRMAVGGLSLALAVLLLVSPAGVLFLLMEILGIITLLLGIMLCINGVRLGRWMREVPA